MRSSVLSLTESCHNTGNFLGRMFIYSSSAGYRGPLGLIKTRRKLTLIGLAVVIGVIALAACGFDSAAPATAVPSAPTSAPRAVQATAAPPIPPTPSGISVVQPVPSEPVELIGKGDTARPKPGSQTRPSGAHGFSHFFFEEVGGEVITTLVEGLAGKQVRSNLSYLQLKQLHEQGQPPPEELQMTLKELGELVGQLDTVRQATEKYQDVEVALDDGYEISLQQVPNMGAHFRNSARMEDGVFNPAEPEFLLYIQVEGEEWELVGTGFLLPTNLPQPEPDHPEAFVGPLDNWHVHYSVCVGGRGNIDSATPEECEERRGFWQESYGWMIHAYVWVDNPLGVFTMWNPNIPPVMPAENMRGTSPFDNQQHEGEVATTIENFSHRDSRVKVAETLVWTNMDAAPHTVTSGPRGVAEPGFDSGLMGPGQSFALKFDQPGSYSFTCTLHPTMNGEIVVTE